MKHKYMFFLKFPCFLHDTKNVSNLSSDSSVFSKSSLHIWKFSAHVLLKPSMKDFEHNLGSMWNDHNYSSEHSLTLPFLGMGMIIDLFQSYGHCSVFQIIWHTECITLTASSFRTWNSSAGIPSLLLALFLVMLPQAHLTSHFRMSGSRLSDHTIMVMQVTKTFFCTLLCILATSINFFCFC